MTRFLKIIAMLTLAGCAATPPPSADKALLRVATFNLALNDNAAGGVIARLQGEDSTARKLAAIIQTVRPDVILLNELDFDSEARALNLFQQRYLEQGAQAIRYPYRYVAPVNTGVDSGFDLNGDGNIGMPEDAWGYGAHPGQYAMAVLSMFPIDTARVRSFQRFRWAEMPNAQRPQNPDGSWYQPDAIWQQLRLSSKSHWDLPIQTPNGEFHLLASHPTPPVFDGPEDRNGRRNHDEIRLFADYIDPERSGYLVDDNGVRGGLTAGAAFVIVGDNNADPNAGSSFQNAIAQFLQHRLIQAIAPKQMRDKTQSATADFGAVGELRVDYVLPSRQFKVIESGVFWPNNDDPQHAWIDASDHRLVWADLKF
jgi:endonuclease/exonuclease/phosphatase family metal-dependent hydrolase